MITTNERPNARGSERGSVPASERRRVERPAERRRVERHAERPNVRGSERGSVPASEADARPPVGPPRLPRLRVRAAKYKSKV
jgi:hypothetical protein